MQQITPELISGLPKTGATDPIEFYRRPLVGRLFRERINMGLRLLPSRRFERGLEIGYGAGAVLLTLAGGVKELHGIDLDADPETVRPLLAARGHSAELIRANVYELPYASSFFDLAVCFSVFEHLHEYAKGLVEVRRVLAPGGLFLLGMPAVNRAMEVGFRAIGFKGIEDHHVTRPSDVSGQFHAAGFEVVAARQLKPGPLPLTLYYTWLLRPIAASR